VKDMEKQKFVTTTLCILLVLYATFVFTAPSFASPSVSICKRFLDTSDSGPYEMRKIYHWDIEIRVLTDVALTDANVYDRFGGELKIDHITIPSTGKTWTFTYPNYPNDYPTRKATVTIDGMTYKLDSDIAKFGTKPYGFIIYWSGMTHKVNFQWVIGNLPAGYTSIIVGVSTDLNPGGKQEFTSPCEHVLNSGAALKAKCGSRLISAYSESLCVKVACPGKLLIDKFNDANGNGLFDLGELKITGWRVDVTDPYGVVTTYYTPVDLEINDYGAYIITEEVRTDWTQTAVFVDGVPQTVDPTVTVTINLGETREVLYGNTYCPPPGRLGIKKFYDKDNDGVFDGTDEWLAGWDVDVTDPSGDVSTLSTPVGLSITEFGVYSITEHLPPYWVQTALIVDGVPQAVDPTATVTVNSGDSRIVIYGNWLPPGCLQVKKFHDKDGNGVFDDGTDEWITGWNIDVEDPSGDTATYPTPVKLEITEFGLYTITEDLPAGWEQTVVFVDGIPQALDPTTTVTVDPGEPHEVIYGNKLSAGRLIIKKFNDTDGNGVFDGSDVWLTSWNIDVTDPSGDLTSYSALPVDLVITEFGKYTITEAIPAGWVQTVVFVDGMVQTLDPTVTVTVDPGASHEVVYGNGRPPKITVSLSVSPFSQSVGKNIVFSWSIINPVGATPIHVTLTLIDPLGGTIVFDEGVTLIGSETWTAKAPTGYWLVLMTYEYKWAGTVYTAGTFSDFQVTP